MSFTPTSALVIVAHPDDETLWAGGTILKNPSWNWYVITMCRGSDPDRASRFKIALKQLSAKGVMGDLDDGPHQIKLNENLALNTLKALLPRKKIDVIVTHDPLKGEYTRHLRHEETARTVFELCQKGDLTAEEIWTFAYTDEDGRKYATAEHSADYVVELDQNIWEKKYDIITKTYGFQSQSFEAMTTPRKEAFRCFKTSEDAIHYLKKGISKI